ncbi:RND superfamily efflux pump MFP component [Halioglobus japonicus]|uniref:Efflux RND transporter periplasmic adaptor subunit n=1 Tax=Halioglobus japonicus TaxID=930805 RepID=A0AAP8MFY4_9GAMM|nr:efflux RND transporter periplasmic adaptor subunit [Halioglobus japonicus]PLW87081.1 efflux RND transporter periplasmic adaptor subunit [Halioglobus japonicus]GHD10300.1 RND superfamily efflux pump MFP component [Halioglobus japonicus]
MASIKKQTLVSALLLGGAATIAAILFLNRPPAQMAEPEYRPVTIDVAVAVKETINVHVQAQGTVTPLRETALLSEVSGRIIETAENFLVGGFVSKGDVLMRIDPRDYQTDLLRAQASVESAESNLAQEKGRAEVALREWQKLPANAQRSQEAKDLYLRKPQLEQAEAQLLAAMADLNTARDRLERTVIKAPYNAIIRSKDSELGQFVGAGTRLAAVFSVDQAEVRLPIPQSKLDYLALPGVSGYDDGASIDLYTDVAGEVKHWPARLHRTEGVFDERSRVLYTVARVDDPYALNTPDREPLRLGTFVNADISGRNFDDIVALPRYILRAGNLVWVIDEDNLLRNRRVEVLRTGGDTIYVGAGLDDGDRVSLTSLDASLIGTKVEINSSTDSDVLNGGGEPVIPEETPEDVFEAPLESTLEDTLEPIAAAVAE